MNSFLNKLRSKKTPTFKPKTLDQLFKEAKKAVRIEGKKFDTQFTELTVPKAVRMQNAMLWGGGAFCLLSAGLVVALLPLLVRTVGYYTGDPQQLINAFQEQSYNVVATQDPAYPYVITDDVRNGDGAKKRFLPLSIEDVQSPQSQELLKYMTLLEGDSSNWRVLTGYWRALLGFIGFVPPTGGSVLAMTALSGLAHEQDKKSFYQKLNEFYQLGEFDRLDDETKSRILLTTTCLWRNQIGCLQASYGLYGRPLSALDAQQLMYLSGTPKYVATAANEAKLTYRAEKVAKLTNQNFIKPASLYYGDSFVDSSRKMQIAGIKVGAVNVADALSLNQELNAIINTPIIVSTGAIWSVTINIDGATVYEYSNNQFVIQQGGFLQEMLASLAKLVLVKSALISTPTNKWPQVVCDLKYQYADKTFAQNAHTPHGDGHCESINTAFGKSANLELVDFARKTSSAAVVKKVLDEYSLTYDKGLHGDDIITSTASGNISGSNTSINRLANDLLNLCIEKQDAVLCNMLASPSQYTMKDHSAIFGQITEPFLTKSGTYYSEKLGGLFGKLGLIAYATPNKQTVSILIRVHAKDSSHPICGTDACLTQSQLTPAFQEAVHFAHKQIENIPSATPSPKNNPVPIIKTAIAAIK